MTCQLLRGKASWVVTLVLFSISNLGGCSTVRIGRPSTVKSVADENYQFQASRSDSTASSPSTDPELLELSLSQYRLPLKMSSNTPSGW
jgi:hypothetical protein